MENLFQKCEEYLPFIGFIRDEDQKERKGLHYIFEIEEGHHITLSLVNLPGAEKPLLSLQYARNSHESSTKPYVLDDFIGGLFVENIEQIKFVIENSLRFQLAIEYKQYPIKIMQ